MFILIAKYLTPCLFNPPNEEIAPPRNAIPEKTRRGAVGLSPTSRHPATLWYGSLSSVIQYYCRMLTILNSLVVCSFMERRIDQRYMGATKAFLVKETCSSWFICILMLPNITFLMIRTGLLCQQYFFKSIWSLLLTIWDKHLLQSPFWISPRPSLCLQNSYFVI